MRKIVILISFLGFSFSALANVYNIKQLGADTQAKIICTKIINQAILKASRDGGGTIFFPAGKYLTGPIHLKSNITLDFEAGAVVKFSDDFNDYLPFVRVRYEGIFMKTFSPLIYGVGVHNVTIKGEGEIDGNGFKWWQEFIKDVKEVRSNGRITKPNTYQKMWVRNNSKLAALSMFQHHFCRPPFIQLIESQNIHIENITIHNSPFWTVDPVGCNNVTVTGITIFNPAESYNTDGINPSSCRNVRIANCMIHVGDDCVTIKSGRDKFGRDYGKPCENITITNCVMLSGHGGVVIGSEMSGGVKDVTISNCVFDGTDNGIRIKSARGRGGVVENIRVDNIVMRNIRKTAFVFNLHYDRGTHVEPVSVRTPIFRNIHISNVTGTGVNTVGIMTGIEEMPVNEVSFNNINMTGEKGFSATIARNLHFRNIDIAVKSGPSLSFANCKDVVLDDVRSNAPVKNQAILQIDSCQHVLINNCYQMKPAAAFAEVSRSHVIWGTNFLDDVQQRVLNHK